MTFFLSLLVDNKKKASCHFIQESVFAVTQNNSQIWDKVLQLKVNRLVITTEHFF